MFWGSEESDLAERCAITFTTAVFSKQGTHKSHANEDRYAIRRAAEPPDPTPHPTPPLMVRARAILALLSSAAQLIHKQC